MSENTEENYTTDSSYSYSDSELLSEHDDLTSSMSSSGSSFNEETGTGTETESSMSSNNDIDESSKQMVHEVKKKKICIAILSFILTLFVILSVVLFIIFCRVIRSKKNRVQNYETPTPNGLRYGYVESRRVNGEVVNIHGTLFLESDKLIGKNYEIIMTNDEDLSILVYDDDGAAGIGFLDAFSVDKDIKKYDCKTRCLCRDKDEQIVVVEEVFETLLFTRDDNIEKETKFVMKDDLCKKNVDKFYLECDLDYSDVKCTERENDIKWRCSGSCNIIDDVFANDQKGPFLKPVSDDIIVTASDREEATYMAEIFILQSYCEKQKDSMSKTFLGKISPTSKVWAEVEKCNRYY